MDRSSNPAMSIESRRERFVVAAVRCDAFLRRGVSAETKEKRDAWPTEVITI